MIDVFISCVPPTTTAQQKRMMFRGSGISPLVFKTEKGQEAQDLYEGLLLKDRPQRPIPGPLSLEIEVVWPYRQKDISSKAKKAKAESDGRQPYQGKPDLDNWAKQFIDCLVCLRYIEKDQQVAELVLRKFVGTTPGISLKIRTI